jgi:magnesium chelatase family protein
MAALVGGGTRPRPGEAALAHLGLLFLDELPEFHPQVLDALRQPLETGETVIARANHRIAYPSRIQLIAAMNPCRCAAQANPVMSAARDGLAPSAIRRASRGRCSTASTFRSRYPPSLPQTSFCRGRPRGARTCGRASRKLAASNAECDGAVLEEIVAPEPQGLTLLRDAADALSLSARGYHRTLPVARTLADLLW